jgi:hypothetical protein
MSYAKLFSSITESSLWSASKETRLLFLSMLARANAVGFVEASVPGLARISNLTLEETQRALDELCAPDPYDKSGNNEGRRLVKLDGGWGLVNYEVYRNRRDEEERREYMREYMARYRKKKSEGAVGAVSSVNSSKPQLAQAEAAPEAAPEAKNANARAPEARPSTDAERWPYVQSEPWAQTLKRVGRVKIGPQNWPAWKTLLDECFRGDPAALAAFAAKLDPEKRWPDHVEAEYRKRRPDALAQAEGRKVVIL